MPTWWTCVAAAALTTFPQIAAAVVAPTTATVIRVVDKPDARQANAFFSGNWPPFAPSPFMKLSIGAIEPRGWLRKQLTLEADGMVGHLPELSKFVADPAKSAWGNGTGEGDLPWEEAPYWLKGYADMGYILDAESIEPIPMGAARLRISQFPVIDSPPATRQK